MSEELCPLPFHEALASALQGLEPGLWRWFASDGYSKKYADGVRLELLRSTYRLPQELHEKLYTLASEVARTLHIDVPLTLYQSQGDSALNAALVFVPDEVHVVLRGPVEETLSDPELKALFGHELAHHKLWTENAGRYRIADSVVEHMASHSGGAPSHVQSALRQRRWTEVYADRGSLVASGDLHAAVACLVKMTTGLRQVDAQAYLAQAVEATLDRGQASEGLTHPEVFIRAFALRAWHASESEAEVARLVEGKLELEALDLVQQRALTSFTLGVLERALLPDWMRTEANLAHARRFFPDHDFSRPAPAALALPDGGESLAEYVSYLLLDFGMADREIEEVSLAHMAHLARELGVHAVLAKIARKELRISAAAYAELEARGAELAERGLPAGQLSAEVSP